MPTLTETSATATVAERIFAIQDSLREKERWLIDATREASFARSKLARAIGDVETTGTNAQAREAEIASVTAEQRRIVDNAEATVEHYILAMRNLRAELHALAAVCGLPYQGD